jgi:hypothetical protein
MPAMPQLGGARRLRVAVRCRRGGRARADSQRV